jgi:hypothetical protein
MDLASSSLGRLALDPQDRLDGACTTLADLLSRMAISLISLETSATQGYRLTVQLVRLHPALAIREQIFRSLWELLEDAQFPINTGCTIPAA